MLEQLIDFFRWQLYGERILREKIISEDKASRYAYNFAQQHVMESMMCGEQTVREDCENIALLTVALSDGQPYTDGAILYCLVKGVEPDSNSTFQDTASSSLCLQGFTEQETHMICQDLYSFTMLHFRYRHRLYEPEPTLTEQILERNLSE